MLITVTIDDRIASLNDTIRLTEEALHAADRDGRTVTADMLRQALAENYAELGECFDARDGLR